MASSAWIQFFDMDLDGDERILYELRERIFDFPPVGCSSIGVRGVDSAKFWHVFVFS